MEEAAERYNNDVADDPEQGAITFQRLSNHENWPRSANSHPPSIALLQGFAKLYHCAPGDLIEGTDHTFQAERPASIPAIAAPPAPAGHDVALADQTALWDAEAAARKQAGKELGRLRREVGLSQQDLANRIGYARGHVAGAETGANRTAPDFWERCDTVLAAGGALVAAGDRIKAAQQARTRAAALREEAAREARLQQWRAEHGIAGSYIEAPLAQPDVDGGASSAAAPEAVIRAALLEPASVSVKLSWLVWYGTADATVIGRVTNLIGQLTDAVTDYEGPLRRPAMQLLARGHEMLGKVAFDQLDYATAFSYFLKMQRLGEQLGDCNILELAAIHQGDLLRRRGEYDLAVQRLESAACYAPEAIKAVEGLRQQTLARAHAEHGDKDAFCRAMERRRRVTTDSRELVACQA